jgi:hypothetical protein
MQLCEKGVSTYELIKIKNIVRVYHWEAILERIIQ